MKGFCMRFVGLAKAKKNKKKISKPGVRVKPPKKKPQTDEIQISQNTPTAEEYGYGSQHMGQGVNSQPSIIIDLQAPQRMKQTIIRPQTPPTTTPSAGNSAAVPPITHGTQIPISNGLRVISTETMATTSSETAVRLFSTCPHLGLSLLGINEKMY
ncbi:hypothetical protein PIB30_070481 [Stylosanthes scabra]|uniref:Uncharacterized protein n=1 Tax=Stylosanthes scabra TaxID=79078 RepID=A0ABU6YMX3_9FABA|nr:hypothetical protein [Stylosanthes scabra]